VAHGPAVLGVHKMHGCQGGGGGDVGGLPPAPAFIVGNQDVAVFADGDDACTGPGGVEQGGLAGQSGEPGLGRGGRGCGAVGQGQTQGAAGSQTEGEK